MADIDFRTVFRPVQPGLGPKSGALYTEVSPHPHLSQYIYCYWRLRSTVEVPFPFIYRVIPDGCIDIFFNVNDCQEAWIMGFATEHNSFSLHVPFDYIGVRFMPAAFAQIFDVDAAILTNQQLVLSDVVTRFGRELSQLLEGESDLNQIRKSLDCIFLKQIAGRYKAADKRLYNAIHIILKSHGNVNLKSEIDTGLSSRQLRRLFEFYIGDSPKIFSKVVRFQYFLELLSSRDRHKNHKFFLDAGYYDQPHFNKEFKAFFGLAPGEALSS